MTRDDELWLAMGNLIGNGTIGDGQHDGQWKLAMGTWMANMMAKGDIRMA